MEKLEIEIELLNKILENDFNDVYLSTETKKIYDRIFERLESLRSIKTISDL